MPRLRDPGRIRLALAATALVVLPACSMPSFLKVAKPEDGVTVKNLTTDLAFGVEEQAATAPSQAAPAAATWEQAMYEFLAPDFEFDFSDGTSPPPPPPPPPGPCPTASETTYPELAATLLVEQPPIPGTYRWKQDGTVEIVGFPKLPVAPLTTRVVRVLEPVGPDVVAVYEMEQHTLAGREINTIEVRYSEEAQAPTHGVYLTRFQFKGGNVDIDFNPPPGGAPKLLSMPLTSGPVSATAVDVEDRLVLQVTGTMDASTRHRLDACGELVEAWKFSGQRVLQGLPPNEADSIRNTTWDFYIAPQLGGLIVGDRLVTQGSFGPLQYTSDITTVIGDLDPRKD